MLPVWGVNALLNVTDEENWLSRLGYDIESLAPQLSRKFDFSKMNKFQVESGFFSQLSQKMMTGGLSSLSLPEARMRLDPLHPSFVSAHVQQKLSNE